MKLTKRAYGWPEDAQFLVPDGVSEHFAAGIGKRGANGTSCSRPTGPWLLGGSADLGPSNKTTLKFDGAGEFACATPGGRNPHFGVREHAMAAIVNGMSLSKLRAFGATFFIFSDYARGAIRLSALMELPTLMVFTHDAMGDGEDGPPISRSSNWHRCARSPG